MNRALLVSPYFPPSNLAGVQRTRLMALYLGEFGWDPIVVCVRPDCYEEPNDESSLVLLPERLRVERVGAWPAKVCRPLGFGDVSLRAQWAMRRKVGELARRREADLVFATVLPGYTSLVGAWAKRTFSLPFVLDYQDPWVSDWGAKQARSNKAGLAHWLATKMEPCAVQATDALTAVSDETLLTLRERGLVRNGLPVEIIPIGADANDHAVAARVGKSLVAKKAGEFAMAYVGTITDRMLSSVLVLFRAAREISQLTLHFVGTSAQPNGTDTHALVHLANECGIGERFHLEPRRVGYLDALRTMQEADGLLLIGSTDSHYTASKIFPCWLSGKPIIALFHARSTVNELAGELGGVRVVAYDDSTDPERCVETVAKAIGDLVKRSSIAIPARNESAFEPYSARSMARRYATLFDRVVGNES